VTQNSRSISSAGPFWVRRPHNGASAGVWGGSNRHAVGQNREVQFSNTNFRAMNLSTWPGIFCFIWELEGSSFFRPITNFCLGCACHYDGFLTYHGTSTIYERQKSVDVYTQCASSRGSPNMSVKVKGPVTGRGPADHVVISTPPPAIQAVQTRKINCDHSWES
jgi:hypothetical protein